MIEKAEYSENQNVRQARFCHEIDRKRTLLRNIKPFDFTKIVH